MSKTLTFPLSFAVHIGLAAALTVLPLLAEEPLPESADRVVEVDALFVPAPPPPPGRGGTGAARAVPRVPSVAPPLVPTTTSPDPDVNSVGAADDAVYDVADVGDEPGAAGGVVGSVLSDLPAASPAPPRVVRISTGLAAPRLVRRNEPAYPALAGAARLTATVVLEAEVDPSGRVARVSVVSGHALFDEAAIEAVRQWRYQPLLLNGEPTAFILTVTVRFDLRR